MKSAKATSSLDELAHLAGSTRKYSSICPSLVRELAAQEAARRSKQDDIVKHVRARLHQAAGAYIVGRPEYEKWLEQLSGAGGDAGELRGMCCHIMARHASTNERIGSLDDFYSAVFDTVGPVKSVADLACGFNPLAIPWMRLEHGCRYLALDVYADMAVFLDRVLPLLGVQGKAVSGNLLEPGPLLDEEFDLVLLLKVLPCLEQLRKGAGAELLKRLRARYVAVSYPALSLGGREKGMEEFYEQRFSEMLAETGWDARRFQFPHETLYIVRKDV